MGRKKRRGAVFECVVCGSHTRSTVELFGSFHGVLPICGFRCRRRFLLDPLKYVPVEAELGVGD
jgi:hypothetical protein